MKRILLVAAASGAAMFGVAAVAAPAMASTGPGTVTAVTHIQKAQDTTSGTATSVLDPRFGPVWAYDNITKQFTVTQTGVNADGSHSYKVDLQVHGSFDSFSDPNTGLPYPTALDVTGSVSGVNTYYVNSPTPPDPSAVSGQEPDNTGTGTILDQLFHSQETAVPDTNSGNWWVFKYQHAGNVMIQRYDTAPSTWGDVVSSG
jgi:hypothetical protein